MAIIMATPQVVSGGQQFDGSTNKGRFEWPQDKSGVEVVKINLHMGSESKNWSIRTVNRKTGKINGVLSAANASIVEDVLLVLKLGVSVNDRIEFHTTGLTGEASATVWFRDEPAREAGRGR